MQKAILPQNPVMIERTPEDQANFHRDMAALRLHLADEAMSEHAADRAAAMIYLSDICTVHGPEVIVDVLELAHRFGLRETLAWARNCAAIQRAEGGR